MDKLYKKTLKICSNIGPIGKLLSNLWIVNW